MTQETQIVIYKAKDGQTKLDVQLKDETVWLNLAQLTEHFQRDKSVISRHINNVFEEGELSRSSTVAKYATVQTEGSRQIKRKIEFFNLDVIISVGYRIKSKRGTQFRIWANQIIKDYLVKGYVLNEKRLTETQNRLDEVTSSIKLMGRIIKQNALTANENEAFLNLITDYAFALELLDKYDHQQVEDVAGTEKGIYQIT